MGKQLSLSWRLVNLFECATISSWLSKNVRKDCEIENGVFINEKIE